jgi:CubicO group peptidase (beta-lactamase class C family)
MRTDELGSIDETVDQQIQALLEQGKIPSLTASIIVGDQIVWAKGYAEQPFNGHAAQEVA